MKQLDFYFDFISPYAYLASDAIQNIAARHGYSLQWKPFRLGVAVVKVMGLKPLMETPLKGEYVSKDVERLAAVLEMPLNRTGGQPAPEPPARLFYACQPGERQAMALTLLRARWRDGLDIGDEEVLRKIAADMGMDANQVDYALADPQPRLSWTETTREALDRGVFGSPTAAVGRALFWGVDRLWLLDTYLTGGEAYVPVDADRRKALAIPDPGTTE